MNNFMTCLVDGDLTALGKAPQHILEETWITIISEYQQLRGDTVDGVDQLRLLKLINRTKHHLYLFELSVNFLEHTYSESIAKSLNRLGYPFHPVVKEPAKYRNDLQSCVLRSKHHYVQLEGWLKELDAAVKRQTVKPTRDYFENTLINIEQMQHVSYSLDTMTVSKFVMLEKKLSKLVMKQQNGK